MSLSISTGLFLTLLVCALTVDPPLYNESYHQTFDQIFIVNGTHYEVNGQIFFDPIKNRQRMDRVNGRYDAFCGPIVPNVSTPCVQYAVDGKRWIAFPQKQICCFCCDSAHGCGPMKADWLSDAEYKGEEKIIDTIYDKWSKDGSFGYNYYWTSKDQNRTPRRLDENGTHITDYSVHSFNKQTFPDSIFALPQYCNTQKIVNCPLESACGYFRSPSTKTK